MKTRIDDAVYRFMANMIEEDSISEQFQELLDITRERFDIDSVSIIEKNGSKNIYTYRFESISRPEYTKMGVNMVLTDEEYQETLHMYDESPICERIVKTAEEFGVSHNIIHYGFVRENFTVSDGSICFENFKEHTWTDEERAALVKIGKIFKMINCAALADGMFDSFYEKIDQEREQYLKGLTDGAAYSFSMDITDGFVRNKIMTSTGIDIVNSAGLSLPASYDELCGKYLDKLKFITNEMRAVFSCKGLTDLYNSGSTHPEVEYYHSEWDAYIRVTVFMFRDKNDGHIHGLFVAVDTTEQKRRQELQQRALEEAFEAANQANAAKSLFLSNMSHDIRTPMNAIIGMTSIAAAHIGEKDKVADCLEKISVSSKHLLDIINNVLDMSKIESGQIELQNEEFALSSLIDGVVSIVRPLITEKNHTLSVEIDDVRHDNVIGDTQRLRQVFVNLIGNAAKYTPENGKIKITVREKPINQPKAGIYEFVVEDNGIGMSEEYMKNLFSPFSRANDSRVRDIQGTGLGLPIARNIIQMMNGDIRAESRLDDGTKFVVNLLLEFQDAEEAPREKPAGKTTLDSIAPAPKASYKGKRALLVEDNLLNSEIAIEIMSMTELETEPVYDGTEAVEKMSSVPEGYYDIIFMDIMMPIMNGYDAARAIRALPRRDVKTLPIIAMTANAFAEDVEKSREAGMNEHVSKPIEMNKLFGVMGRWL